MPGTRLTTALAIAALALPAAAAAQDAVPPRLPDHLLIRSTAASPPALTRAQAMAQPLHKSSWEHYQALKRMARPAPLRLPDWNGVWLNAEPYQFDPGYHYSVKTPAPLTPDAQARYDKVVADAAKGIEWDQLSDCLPAGYPRMLSERRPYEFIVSPKQVWLLGELMNEVHRIYTDGRGHKPDDESYPLWGGDSIGFWDGDTLIVHTASLRGVPNGYQRSGPPMSDQASTVEQWRMVDPDHIVLQMTVYDPVNLAEPWRPAPRTYYRPKGDVQGLRLEYFACENSGVRKDTDGSTHIILPGEPGFGQVGSAASR